MNTLSSNALRSGALALSLVAGFGISAPSYARPADPGWHPQLATPSAKSTSCEPVLKRVPYGRSGYKVVSSRGDCKEGQAQGKVRWAGPRATIPVNE